MKRGEIWWASLSPRSGSEQKGNRPVIIISHEGFNQNPRWRSVIVVPLSTSRAQAKRGPTAVFLPGLIDSGKDSVALCHQITTLERAKLSRCVGSLPPAIMSEIEQGIRAALSMVS